ncbi:MAG: NAD(P)/FAD-dependent oxidoreductase [Chloroflexi bacterium]|nr:NAD(P)/FAD-dependent oxidoreductase [Chloroflexota bacterium]
MARDTVIVIGAGLAGLSAGCYAQMNGYQTRIFEHHTAPGGVATAWTHGEYTIEGGIHFLMGYKPGQPIYELYKELGTLPKQSILDLTTYSQYMDEASGRSVILTQDLCLLANDLKAISPADTAIIDELIGAAQDLNISSIMNMGMETPPELTSWRDRIKQIWDMRRMFRYYTGKFSRSITDYTVPLHDPWLRWILRNLFLPEVPVWFILMLLGLLSNGQMGLLPGGSPSLVLPIEKRFKDLGGYVSYDATVEQILVQHDAAIGIRLIDGSEYHAGTIISAADGYSTIFKMLNGRYVNNQIRDRYYQWPMIRPMVTVNLGVSREFRNEPHLKMIYLADPFSISGLSVHELMVRIFNYSSRFAPPGKTVVQVGFETDWDIWNRLHEDPERYRSEKEQASREIIKCLERHYPGLSPLVEVIDVTTPYTTWRYTLNHHGAYEGWLPTPEILTATFPRALPGLANFYMAGQWVVPGGGVPPCLYSGRQAIQLLCHRDGKTFRSQPN